MVGFQQLKPNHTGKGKHSTRKYSDLRMSNLSHRPKWHAGIGGSLNLSTGQIQFSTPKTGDNQTITWTCKHTFLLSTQVITFKLSIELVINIAVTYIYLFLPLHSLVIGPFCHLIYLMHWQRGGIIKHLKQKRKRKSKQNG